GTCASKYTGDRYGPQTDCDCRRYRLAAQAAQRESRQPAFPRHPHERGAQTDVARVRGGQEPERTSDQAQRPRRAGPEETKRLTFRASRRTAIGALGAPRIRLRRAASRLLDLDVAGLDHFSPALGFAAYLLAEALGRAAHQAQPGLLQAILDARVLDGRVERRVQLLHRRPW